MRVGLPVEILKSSHQRELEVHRINLPGRVDSNSGTVERLVREARRDRRSADCEFISGKFFWNFDARRPNKVCHANVNKEMIVKSKLLWRRLLGSCAAGWLGMHLQAAAFAQVPAPPITPNPAPPIRPNPAPPITPNPAPPITPNPAPPIVPNPALPIESPTPTPSITPLPS